LQLKLQAAVGSAPAGKRLLKTPHERGGPQEISVAAKARWAKVKGKAKAAPKKRT